MYEITKQDIEGVDYINISTYSKIKLGKMLSPGYPVTFKTVLGYTGSIRNGINFLTIKDYPIKLVSKRKLSYQDVKLIQSLECIKINNYLAHLIYLLSLRIQQDTEICDALSMLPKDIKITSFNYNKDTLLNVTSVRYNDNVDYCKAVTTVLRLIQDGDFNDANINQLITDSKDTDTALFTNIANTVMLI